MKYQQQLPQQLIVWISSSPLVVIPLILLSSDPFIASVSISNFYEYQVSPVFHLPHFTTTTEANTAAAAAFNFCYSRLGLVP